MISFPGLRKRLSVVRELWRMAKDRKLYLLMPVFVMLTIALFLLFVGELPVLIPFFYAVF